MTKLRVAAFLKLPSPSRCFWLSFFLLAAFVSHAESVLGMSQQRLIAERSELQMAASSLSSGWMELGTALGPTCQLAPSHQADVVHIYFAT